MNEVFFTPMVVDFDAENASETIDFAVVGDDDNHDFEVGMEINPVYTDADPYDGTYEITPTTTDQTVPTKDKLMANDMTVHAIPYYETSNDSGGYTAIIG